MGLQARQDYRIINLWEIDVNLVFEREFSTLLPFVPVLKGGGQIEVIGQAVQRLQDDEQLSELEPLLGFFASFVLEQELVSQILRWDMSVLRESPWYQEIRQEGRVEGRVEGLLEGEQSLVLRQLSRRIGDLSPDMQAQVRSLSQPEIERLGEALLDFSGSNDLINWLQALQL